MFDNAMVVNGWNLYFTDIFENQLDKLVKEVEALAEKDPGHFYKHPKYKLLLAIEDNIYRKIPLNPNDVKYRLGATLGKKHSHWRRVKKNNLPSRYRLFFQFRSDSRTIIYAWFNDESSLRKDGAKTDVYTVFEAMLKNGNPPSTWEDLEKKASSIKKSP
ncbi:MAG: type II toxin-antitoxin system YhaV family toxin [Methylococcales bacterium]|nr:type II toxin-antitoxin system YhaV family toxin [Methylococcales bacterium]